MMRKQKDQPLDLSSNANVVRHLEKLVKVASNVDTLLGKAIQHAEEVSYFILTNFHIVIFSVLQFVPKYF